MPRERLSKAASLAHCRAVFTTLVAIAARASAPFNGLVIAAKSALEEGAESVIIVDLDTHCGGGTHSLIADDPAVWQLDVSVDGFGHYTPSERTTLDLVGSADDYLPTINRRLEAFTSSGRSFGLCLYNAGMDPFEDCSTGGLSGIGLEILAERERRARAAAGESTN